MSVTTCSSFADLSKKLHAKAEDISARVNAMRKKNIVVGIPPESRYPNGQKIVDIARMIEYGTKNIGPRPFFRLAAEENAAKWTRMLSKGVREEVRRHKRPVIRPTLIAVGEEMQKDIRKTMLDLDVWDTGRMHSSISILKVR